MIKSNSLLRRSFSLSKQYKQASTLSVCKTLQFPLLLYQIHFCHFHSSIYTYNPIIQKRLILMAMCWSSWTKKCLCGHKAAVKISESANNPERLSYGGEQSLKRRGDQSISSSHCYLIESLLVMVWDLIHQDFMLINIVTILLIICTVVLVCYNCIHMYITAAMKLKNLFFFVLLTFQYL